MDTAPSNPPSNVKAVVVSPTAVLVTWDKIPPIDQNGIITKYVVLHESVGKAHFSVSEHDVSRLQTSLTLTNLSQKYDSLISVRGYTIEGGGPYSDEVFVRNSRTGKHACI